MGPVNNSTYLLLLNVHTPMLLSVICWMRRTLTLLSFSSITIIAVLVASSIGIPGHSMLKTLLPTRISNYSSGYQAHLLQLEAVT